MSSSRLPESSVAFVMIQIFTPVPQRNKLNRIRPPLLQKPVISLSSRKQSISAPQSPSRGVLSIQIIGLVFALKAEWQAIALGWFRGGNLGPSGKQRFQMWTVALGDHKKPLRPAAPASIRPGGGESYY